MARRDLERGDRDCVTAGADAASAVAGDLIDEPPAPAPARWAVGTAGMAQELSKRGFTRAKLADIQDAAVLDDLMAQHQGVYIFDEVNAFAPLHLVEVLRVYCFAWLELPLAFSCSQSSLLLWLIFSRIHFHIIASS
jgi:hypothetical protein